MRGMDAPAQSLPTGIAEQCEPQVRRVLAPNPSPYTYTGTQTYIVGAGDEVVVIDPGPAGGVDSGLPIKAANVFNGQDHVAAIVEAVGNARVAAILCTHTHRDHSPAAAPLKALTGAPIIGCASLIPVIDDGDGPKLEAAYDPDYAPDRVLVDGEVLHGKGWTIEVVATPGHTSNHLCFAHRESGALFTGDHIMGWSTSVISPPDGDMSDYMDSLQKLYVRKDRIYYPAHGPAVGNPRQLVRGTLGHRRQRENQVLRLLEKAPQQIEALTAAMYKGLDERLTMAAKQTVRAHLLGLEKRRAVVCEDGIWMLAA